MPEEQTGLRLNRSGALQIIQISIEADFAEHHHHPEFFEQGDFAVEILRAIGKFIGQRLVLRRGTAHRRRNVSIGESHAIVAPGGQRLRSKAGLMQDRIHEVARTVAGKRTSSAVGAVSARCETENQQPGVGIAESRNRFGPVIPVHVGAPLLLPDLAAVSDQPVTTRAGDDFLVEYDQ